MITTIINNSNNNSLSITTQAITNAILNTPTILPCKDVSEKIALSEPLGLYIKPIARLNITIQLPVIKIPGQVASPGEIIEKLRKQSLPEELIQIKVIKNTLDFLRFEAEIENKIGIKNLLLKLDGCSIQLTSYMELIKVRVAEAKIAYPTRHEWDSFYSSNAQVFNDLKPSERPDTVHFQELPIKWFADKKLDPNKPSETIIRDIFGLFGEIRAVDIPIMDRLNSKFNCDNIDATTNTFDVYVQYYDNISFVKAMDTFRGMKLLYIDRETHTASTINIKVDFDRTRYFSDKEIQKRNIEKLKTIEIDKMKYSQLEKERERSVKAKEIAHYKAQLEETEHVAKSDDTKSKEERRREREEIRRKKHLAQRQHEEEKKLSLKIAKEERKILIAQRKLESMRLLEELFNRVKEIITEEELTKYALPPKPDPKILEEAKAKAIEAERIADVEGKEKEKEQEAEKQKEREREREREREKEKEKEQSKEDRSERKSKKPKSDKTKKAESQKKGSVEKKKKKDDKEKERDKSRDKDRSRDKERDRDKDRDRDRDRRDRVRDSYDPMPDERSKTKKDSKRQDYKSDDYDSDYDRDKRAGGSEERRKAKKERKRYDKSDDSRDSIRKSPDTMRKSKKDSKKRPEKSIEHEYYSRDKHAENTKSYQDNGQRKTTHTSATGFKLKSSVHVKRYSSDQSKSRSSSPRSNQSGRTDRTAESVNSP